jgi:hypothetical protein
MNRTCVKSSSSVAGTSASRRPCQVTSRLRMSAPCPFQSVHGIRIWREGVVTGRQDSVAQTQLGSLCRGEAVVAALPTRARTPALWRHLPRRGPNATAGAALPSLAAAEVRQPTEQTTNGDLTSSAPPNNRGIGAGEDRCIGRTERSSAWNAIEHFLPGWGTRGGSPIGHGARHAPSAALRRLLLGRGPLE